VLEREQPDIGLPGSIRALGRRIEDPDDAAFITGVALPVDGGRTIL
jgi:hypothetical protein